MKELASIYPLGEIVVQSNSFAEGYTEGYNQFLAYYQKNTSISDESIASFFEQAMSSPASRIYNAGYAAGWFAALMQQRGTQEGRKKSHSERSHRVSTQCPQTQGRLMLLPTSSPHASQEAHQVIEQGEMMHTLSTR